MRLSDRVPIVFLSVAIWWQLCGQNVLREKRFLAAPWVDYEDHPTFLVKAVVGGEPELILSNSRTGPRYSHAYML